MHAFFDRAIARNSWSISSRTLREFVEHFGSGTEQLDIYSEDGRVSLTSYTEKIMSGSGRFLALQFNEIMTDFGTEILKQPLRTTIAVDTLEFAEFSVEEQLHIVISVKDFKSIITHAGITNTIVKALYSRPQCPMQLTYSDEGMTSEFILMTSGEVRGLSQAPVPEASRAGSKRPATRQPLEARSNSEMPPPPASAAPSRARENANKRAPRPSPPPPQPSIQSNALFMPQNDEDRRWDPVNDDDDEPMLLWDTGEVDNVSKAPYGKPNVLILACRIR